MRLILAGQTFPQRNYQTNSSWVYTASFCLIVMINKICEILEIGYKIVIPSFIYLCDIYVRKY